MILVASLTAAGLVVFAKTLIPAVQMSFDVRALLIAVRANFWFVPSVLTTAAIAAASIVLVLDPKVGSLPLLPANGLTVETARTALSTIAGSMITIVSLVFSMTLVALTLVSQQLGPRIIDQLMSDRPTQFVLGVFVATFVFTMIMLFYIDESITAGRVPGFGALCSVVLAILSIGTVIHFVHHIGTQIKADVIISGLGGELNQAVTKLVEAAKHGSPHSVTRNAVDDARVLLTIEAAASGYLARYDEATACSIGAEHNLVFRALKRPGEFILAGTPLLEVMAYDGETDALREIDFQSVFRTSERRTPEASIDFELNALVEIALRALSPGINDPFSANACIDRLSDGLRLLLARDTKDLGIVDDDGNIRFLYKPTPFNSYLELAFAPIAEAATTSQLARNHLARAVEDLKRYASDPDARNVIDETGKRLQELSK